MKTLILFSAFVLPACFCEAQSFEKGKGVADAGIGFALYHNEATQTNPDWNEKDTAGAIIFPVNYEYGIMNWLGVGGMFRFSNYIEGDSSSTQAVGTDVSGRINFHAPLSSKRIDLLAGVTFGYSFIRYSANDALGTEAKGHGINFGVEGMARFYFSDHFGIFFNGGYLMHDYPSVVISNSIAEEEFHYSESGFDLGLGIMIKF